MDKIHRRGQGLLNLQRASFVQARGPSYSETPHPFLPSSFTGRNCQIIQICAEERERAPHLASSFRSTVGNFSNFLPLLLTLSPSLSLSLFPSLSPSLFLALFMGGINTLEIWNFPGVGVEGAKDMQDVHFLTLFCDVHNKIQTSAWMCVKILLKITWTRPHPYLLY